MALACFDRHFDRDFRPRLRRATVRPLFDRLATFFLELVERLFATVRFERDEDFLLDAFFFVLEAALRDFDRCGAGSANAIEQVSKKASINDSAFNFLSFVNSVTPVL